MKRLLLVRHGQSTWNAEARWQGHADPPLSGLGERQVAAAIPAVDALGAGCIVTSDLARARRTAELLARDILPLVVEPALRERDAGEWTGLTRAEIDDRYPGAIRARRSPAGFEPDDEVLARVVPALRRLVASLSSDDGVALVVTHGGVIRTLERHLGAPSVAVPNLGGRWIHADGAAAGGLALGERDLLIDPEEVALTIPRQL